MKIDVVQVESELNNKFEIKYNDKLKYKASLPFVTVKDPLNLEKLREIKIYDLNGSEIYSTDYNYIENLKEEIIPMKYLVTGNQKFNQLIFKSSDKNIKIYYEENGIWDNRYVIELNDKKYFVYSIEDGLIRHFPIYDGDIQIGEALKSNVVVDGKDEYCCYIKNEYENIFDAIAALLLYFDRSCYSSSYVVNKEYKYSKKFTYSKANKMYDKEWVKNNFGDEFYKKVDDGYKLVKEKIKHPTKTTKEQIDSLPKEHKNVLKYIVIFAISVVAIIGIFLLLMLL